MASLTAITVETRARCERIARALGIEIPPKRNVIYATEWNTMNLLGVIADAVDPKPLGPEFGGPATAPVPEPTTTETAPTNEDPEPAAAAAEEAA